MSRILITAGPTRECLDPVRFLSNASSGRMGAALATAALQAGWEATVVCGPIETAVREQFPAGIELVPVVSTAEMLAECQKYFPACDGLIAAAAPCDYRPRTVAAHKIRKTGGPMALELIETPDIAATLASGKKTAQWIVAFALETEDQHARAMQKLARKGADLIVVNGPAALDAADASVEVLDKQGKSLGRFSGSKSEIAQRIVAVMKMQLMQSTIEHVAANNFKREQE
jgi:phosphopantothenoylcysteine decarboxylase / phosphopantothenate---cysteine ligase